MPPAPRRGAPGLTMILAASGTASRVPTTTTAAGAWRAPRRTGCPLRAGVRVGVTVPDIHVSRITPHSANIREELGDLTELAASIRIHGIVQPLAVQPHPARPGRYQLLAGHRRLAAAKLARLEMVPCVIRRTAAEPA